jgi:hypothetical protein
MSKKVKGERKGPEKLKFVVEGGELRQSEIVKVLRKLGGGTSRRRRGKY